MRAFAIAGGAALLAAVALAQVPLAPQDSAGTVPQPQFEAEARVAREGELVPQPRFRAAPGGSGIEVVPLGPPGSAGPDASGDARGSGPSQQGSLPQQGPGEALLERTADPDALPGIGDDESLRQERFKSAPGPGGTGLVDPVARAVPIDPVPTKLRPGVRLRELDKMTGQTETFELTVGEERQIDRLKIRLDACRSPETNDTHGTMAFLKVWDVREPDDEAFSGWMFAEAPSLSALDHPRYDVWVISCTTSAVAAAPID